MLFLRVSGGKSYAGYDNYERKRRNEMTKTMASKIKKQLKYTNNNALHNAGALFGNTGGIYGNASGITGNASGITGNVSCLRGEVSGITWNVSGITGNVSGIAAYADEIIEILKVVKK
mgnify:CR=1 FL=1